MELIVERLATLGEAIVAARPVRARGFEVRIDDAASPVVIYHVRYGQFASQGVAEARGEELALFGLRESSRQDQIAELFTSGRERRLDRLVATPPACGLRAVAPLWRSPPTPPPAASGIPVLPAGSARIDSFTSSQATNGGMGGTSRSWPFTSTTPLTPRATSAARSRAAVPSSWITP